MLDTKQLGWPRVAESCLDHLVVRLQTRSVEVERESDQRVLQWVSVVETRSCEWNLAVPAVDWRESPGVADLEEEGYGLELDLEDSLEILVPTVEVDVVVASVLVVASGVAELRIVAGLDVQERWVLHRMAEVEVQA